MTRDNKDFQHQTGHPPKSCLFGNTTQMRILVISPYLPLPLLSGGKVRVFNMLKQLASKAFIDLICIVRPADRPNCENLKQLGINVIPVLKNTARRGYLNHIKHVFSKHPGSMVDYDQMFLSELKRRLGEVKYDCIAVEFLAMAYVEAVIPKEVHKVLTMHFPAEIAYERDLRIGSPFKLSNLYRRLDLHKLRKYEASYAKSYSTIFVTSDKDKQLLIKTVPENKIKVVPNGVDTDRYKPVPYKNEKIVSSICNFAALANVDAIRYFLTSIWPIVLDLQPTCNYYLVGRNVPREILALAKHTRNVVVHGDVEDDREILRRSACTVIPMRSGSGTKIRAFTSLAMNVPVVSTSLGAEGIENAPEEYLKVTDNASQFARYVSDYLSLNGRPENSCVSYIAEKHSWQASSSMFLKEVKSEILMKTRPQN